MARKNFKDIDIYAGIQQKNGQQWQQENGISANWRTPEQIDIQPFSLYIRKKTLKVWSTLTSQQVSLLISVVRTL